MNVTRIALLPALGLSGSAEIVTKEGLNLTCSFNPDCRGDAVAGLVASHLKIKCRFCWLCYVVCGFMYLVLLKGFLSFVHGQLTSLISSKAMVLWFISQSSLSSALSFLGLEQVQHCQVNFSQFHLRFWSKWMRLVKWSFQWGFKLTISISSPTNEMFLMWIKNC